MHKAGRIKPLDPLTRPSAPLFHPILQQWPEHFQFNGCQIEGLTAVGRATIEASNPNHPRRQHIRKVEEAFGLLPPPR